MSIYQQWAADYLDAGYAPIPVDTKTKAPLLKEWAKYSKRLPTEDEVNSWCKNYKDANLGLVMGEACGVVAFDFDYEWSNKSTLSQIEFHTDYNWVMQEVNRLVKKSPAIKVGAKGWTGFYQYSDQRTKRCRRYNAQVFDFISNGAQTVIPPSYHFGAKKSYQWIGEDLINIKKTELPYLEGSKIEDLLFLFRKGQKSVETVGRHHDLLLYAFKMLKHVTSNEELADLLVKKDLKINTKAPYFKEASYHKSSDAIVNAREWIPRIIRSHQQENPEFVLGEKDAKDKKSTAYELYEMFFINEFSGMKRDIITGDTVFIEGKKWLRVENDIPAIRSRALTLGINKSHVEDHLHAYMKTLKAEFLIPLPKWDGIDRIELLRDYISIGNVSVQCFIAMFKEWGANMFRKIIDPEVQNKLILLKGDQGIGKDWLIKSILGGLGNYYAEIDVGLDDKDNAQTLTRLVCANISEFDKTSKVSVSKLKSMITQEAKTYRESYGRRAEKHEFHCSFISTCNVDDILRDYTGNRRYAIFDVTDIRQKYDRKMSLQYLAQFYQLYISNYIAPKQLVLEMDNYIRSQTPDDPELLILDDYYQRIAHKCNNLVHTNKELPKHFSFGEIKFIMQDVSKWHNKTLRQFQQLLKRKELSHRVSTGTVYKIPDICRTTAISGRSTSDFNNLYPIDNNE